MRSTARYTWRIVSIIVVITWWCGTARASPQSVRSTAQDEAWDRSLALEAAGHVAEARTVIVDAFGAQPDSYAPCVRLAWLTLQLGDGAGAAELYRKGRQLPGALPEATTGLVSALTMAGYHA